MNAARASIAARSRISAAARASIGSPTRIFSVLLDLDRLDEIRAR